MQSSTYSASEAAAYLGCTTQSIRDWVGKQQLKGRKVDGRWRVSCKSVEAHPRYRKPGGDSGEARLTRVEAQLAALQNEHTAARELADAIGRERDEYRSQAQAAREQALLLNTTVKKLEQAMRALLDGLARQSEALSQSLLPGTAADLER